MTSEDLLDPKFVAELEALKRRLSPRTRSGRPGERTGPRRGGSAEFAEHRPYAPGDDPRRIDWLAYARTGQAFVKQFHTDEDTVVRLLVDASASLAFGAPSKLDAARRLAAAIGYLALVLSERVQVIYARPSAGKPLEPRRERRGRAALPAFLRDLGHTEAQGRLALHDAIDQTVRLASRPGTLVILSDFFDPGPLLGALGRAASSGHDVRLVQVVSPGELSPALEGDCVLIDSETEEAVEVTMDPAALEAYMRAFAAVVDGLRAFARTRSATYVRVTTGEPLDASIRRFVARAVD